MIENEFSFLVKYLPNDLEKHLKKEIKQGYFSNLPSPLRIRKQDDKYFLTKKVPIKEGDASRHNETEILIKEEEFKLLWSICKKSLEKTRYYYPIDCPSATESNLTAEVDLYHGKLEGLVTVEVEFSSESERKNFMPPDWFGRDITQEEWALNSVLCDLDYEKVKKLIAG